MKKLLIFSILTYLSFIINSNGIAQKQNELENKKNLNFVKSENRVIIHLNKTVGDIFPKITKNMFK